MKSISAPFQIVLKLLLKWWWLILICVALGGGVGYFIRSKQPDIYYAQSAVWFGNNIDSVNQQQNTMSFQNLKDLIIVYSALARQANILQPVIDNLNLNMTVDDLNNIIQVQEDQKLPVLNISVGDRNPVTAATIANEIANQIINNNPGGGGPDAAFQREQQHQLQSQITQLQTQYDEALAKGGSLTSAAEIAQNQLDLANIAKTLQETRALYANLISSSGSASDSIRLFYAADATNALRVTTSFVNVILSGVAGLVLALATIILLAFFDDRVQWQENAQELMGLKILGPLGIVSRKNLPLYLISNPTGMESEVLRQLRAKIILAAGGNTPKVITITSYDSGDGKTVAASNLALAWAQAGMKTLLVDGDMRKGNLHEHFHLPNMMGMSDILAGRDDIHVLLGRALLESGYDNLTILPAGRSTADPASLLSKPRFAELIEVMKHQFDAVIMDSVPTIGGPDSAFIGEVSSGVVIVLHAQRTTHKALKRTLQTLAQGKHVNIYGVAFNRIVLQVTATYNQPYYRRTLAISPDQLNRELLGEGKGRGLKLKRNVMVDRASGTRMFSVAATAVQLGVTEATVKEWIKTGYLKAERRGRSQWIPEPAMNALLDKLPRHSYVAPPPPVPAPQAPAPAEGVKPPNPKISTGKIADRIPAGGQREALLAASLREGATENKADSD